MKMRGDWKIDRAAQAIDYDGDIVSLLSVDAIKSGVPIPAPSAPKKQPPPPQKIAPNPPLSSFSFSVLFTFFLFFFSKRLSQWSTSETRPRVHFSRNSGLARRIFYQHSKPEHFPSLVANFSILLPRVCVMAWTLGISVWRALDEAFLQIHKPKNICLQKHDMSSSATAINETLNRTERKLVE